MSWSASSRSIKRKTATKDELVVEARTDPQDIDVVHAGLEARIRLTALNRRNSPTVDAQVLWVSADALSDTQTRQKYFLARLAFAKDPKETFGATVVNPGMMAEVIILTGHSITFDYIFEPIQRVFTRAMRGS